MKRQPTKRRFPAARVAGALLKGEKPRCQHCNTPEWRLRPLQQLERGPEGAVIASRTVHVCPACWDKLHAAAGYERQSRPAGRNHDADTVREIWVHPDTGRRRAVGQVSAS